MERKYKVGDAVKLGNQKKEMTVAGFVSDDHANFLNPPGNYYICRWFESGNRMREDNFHEDALVKVTG